MPAVVAGPVVVRSSRSRARLGTEPIVAPALVTLAASLVWTGEFDEGERWLQRTERALQTDTGPDIRLLVHIAIGMLQAGHGRRREALEEFTAAEHRASCYYFCNPSSMTSRAVGCSLPAGFERLLGGGIKRRLLTA